MAVAVTGQTNTTTTGSTGMSGGTLTCSGSNTYALIAIESYTGDVTTSVTLNGVAATKISGFPTVTGSQDITLYGLIAPTTGAIVINASATRSICVNALCLSGANQSTPVGTAVAIALPGTSSFNTGAITGVDSTGLFVVGLCPRYNPTVSGESGSPTLQGTYQYDGANASLRVATQAGAASFTYSGTFSYSVSGTQWGIYVKAAAPSVKLLAVGGQLIGINGQALHT